MNLKKVQCRWHRFSPSAFPQHRLLSSPTLGYQKYKPYRLDSPTTIRPRTIPLTTQIGGGNASRTPAPSTLNEFRFRIIYKT